MTTPQLADVTQLQLDTATAEAEAATQEHKATSCQLAAAVAKCEQLQLEASESAQRALEAQGTLSEQQQAAAAAAEAAAAAFSTEIQQLVDSLAFIESEFVAVSSRADSPAATVDRMQQLLRDVQDSASAVPGRLEGPPRADWPARPLLPCSAWPMIRRLAQEPWHFRHVQGSFVSLPM